MSIKKPTVDAKLERFARLGIPQTDDTRRAYRELIVTTPGLGESISGVILYDETIRQQKNDGTPFLKVITDAGIIPGIKVDTGAKDMAGHPGEKVTEGLDGLRDRLAEYFQMGARFAKWRAVIAVDDDIPSRGCIKANAHALARYSALCQEAGLVPVVEPEVLMDGVHALERPNNGGSAGLGPFECHECQIQVATALGVGVFVCPRYPATGFGNMVGAGRQRECGPTRARTASLRASARWMEISRSSRMATLAASSPHGGSGCPYRRRSVSCSAPRRSASSAMNTIAPTNHDIAGKPLCKSKGSITNFWKNTCGVEFAATPSIAADFL